MNSYLVHAGTFLSGDGAVGPWGPPMCRLSDSTAAWDQAPAWLREMMPLSKREYAGVWAWMSTPMAAQPAKVAPSRDFAEARLKLVAIDNPKSNEKGAFIEMGVKSDESPEQNAPEFVVAKYAADFSRNATIMQFISNPASRAEYFRGEVDARLEAFRAELMTALGIDDVKRSA